MKRQHIRWLSSLVTYFTLTFPRYSKRSARGLRSRILGITFTVSRYLLTVPLSFSSLLLSLSHQLRLLDLLDHLKIPKEGFLASLSLLTLLANRSPLLLPNRYQAIICNFLIFSLHHILSVISTICHHILGSLVVLVQLPLFSGDLVLGLSLTCLVYAGDFALDDHQEFFYCSFIQVF